jgi:hypothetical protein
MVNANAPEELHIRSPSTLASIIAVIGWKSAGISTGYNMGSWGFMREAGLPWGNKQRYPQLKC